MSKISRMSYKDLGLMIDSAVGAGVLDRASGRAYLADDFLFKMQRLACDYRDQRLLYGKVQAQAQIIREERDKQSPFLARLIRNIHTSFYKFHKLGKVGTDLMKHYQIPNGASRQPANRLKFWITHGQTIVRVHQKRKANGRHLPPPYVLTDKVVEILAEHVVEAEKVVQALQKQIELNMDEHMRLRQLRVAVVDSLELVKRQLELSLYKQPESKRRLTFSAYGILFPDGKGQAHMMGLIEPGEQIFSKPQPAQKTKPKPPPTPIQKKEPDPVPDPEPSQEIELGPTLEPEQKTEPAPKPQPPKAQHKAKEPRTAAAQLEALLAQIKAGKKVRGKTRKLRRLRAQVEAEKKR